MSSLSLVTVIGAVPLVGAAVVAALPEGLVARAKHIALAVSVLTLGLVVVMALQFDKNGPQFQFTEQHHWIEQFGVSYAVGVDGIALVLIALAAALTPVCILAAWHDVPEVGRREQNYFALILVLETFMVGVFAATDVFLFYVFFEAMLIPVYFLIGSFGAEQRQYAAVKFLLYSLAGGLIMLVAVIALYFAGPGGPDGFLLSNLTGLHMGVGAERLMFLGFFFAFAVKAPMFPVHTWLPDAAAEAPPPVAVLLVGVLDKVGTFGMIRFCLPLFPDAAKWATPTVIVLALISIIYGALLAIGQTDIMRLIAYTSISHFGFIVMGIFAMTSPGQSGSTLYMVNHGFSTAALFLVAAMLVKRRGSRRIPDFGGWQRVTPLIAGVFLVAGLSGLALPGLSSFVSEFLVLVGTFARYPAAGVIGTLGIILAAIYILLMYQRMMTGPKPESATTIKDLTTREAWVVAPILVAIIGLGVFPNLVLHVVNPAVKSTMTVVGVTDPAPKVAPAAEGTSK
ncbi:NADH-quinone oxidoreductase subunit M [Angustibacter sp. McL0619]|uniref:NADH-quinone oxidoreductase subunit M n=1 Tax=Angustibacter sp. McL0619 TaxID=3415676 RepID=UPI003CFA28CC